MGDCYYRFVRFVGSKIFWVSSRSTILHRDRVPRSGTFLLVSNHISPIDVPVLIRHTPRKLDFVTTQEMFRKPFVKWFFTHMNAFPLDRQRTDTRGTRALLDRLAAGRVVSMFPEGRLRWGAQSVLEGAPVRPTAARTARLANVPLLPAVVWGTPAYSRIINWLPLKRVRYGIAYGEPIDVADDGEAEQRLAAVFQALYAELREAMDQPLGAAAGAGEGLRAV